jgi:4a-hydroxytetrahydrobiopterin dehydratase
MEPTPATTPAPLTQRTCEARQGEAARVGDAQADAMLAQLPGWSRAAGEIAKTFDFKNYHETMAFVNATAWVSHRQDHHPDLEVGYNKCRVRYSTHSVGGLSENDFICAAKIETLMKL